MKQLRLIVLLSALAAVSACNLTGTTAPPNMSKAIAAVTNAFAQCQPLDTGGSTPGPFTWSYNSPSGGTAVMTLQGTEYAASGYGTWGTLVFTGYVDMASGDTINGTLNLAVFQSTIGSTVEYGAISWTGFTGLVDVSGTLQVAGGTNGNVMYDFLATLNGTTTTLSGTVSAGSTFYDASTGMVTTAPMPTVAFTPTSEYQYTPNVDISLTMSSAGSTNIYYTVDTTLPSSGQGSTQAYPGGSGITSSVSGWAEVVLAYAVGSGPNSRVSMVVYPFLGT